MSRHAARNRKGQRVGAELAGRDGVLAVLVAGSVCRGEHVATSDIDLLVVTAEDSSLEAGSRRLVDGLLVEWIARPEAEWLTRFDRPKTSWLYSFLEAAVLMDAGPASRLVKAARGVLETYRTPAELRELLATALWLGQAKLDRAQAAGTPRELGYTSAPPAPSANRSILLVPPAPLQDHRTATLGLRKAVTVPGYFETSRFRNTP